MNEHQSHGTGRVTGPDGNFVPQIETAERDAEMARMRSRGKSYRDIAAHFEVAVSTAHEGVSRALTAVRAEGGEQARQIELERLDRWQDRVEETLQNEHIVISHGRVVRRRVHDQNGAFVQLVHDGQLVTNADGEPVYAEEEIRDDSAIHQAVAMLLRISQRRAALLGLDAPTKIEASGTVTYELVGISDDDM
jgi:hypothetical protein